MRKKAIRTVHIPHDHCGGHRYGYIHADTHVHHHREHTPMEDLLAEGLKEPGVE